MLADQGFVPPAELDAAPPPPPAPAYGRGGSDRVRHPADGRLRSGPGEHRARELRRGRNRPAVLRAAGRADVRPHLQLALGPGGAVRAALVELGEHPADRAHLDRGVRGAGRATGQLPAGRGRVRPGRWASTRWSNGRRVGPHAGLVRRPALGVRRGRAAGAHLGRARHGRAFRARRGRPVDRAGARARPAGAARLASRAGIGSSRSPRPTGGASTTGTTTPASWSPSRRRPGRDATTWTRPGRSRR